MYGSAGSVSGQRAPACGRRQRVMCPAVHDGAQRRGVGVENQIRPVAERPVVAHRRHRRDAHRMSCGNRRQAAQHVLAVDDVDSMRADAIDQRVFELPPESFVLEIVPDERNAGSRRADLVDVETVVAAGAVRGMTRPWADDRDLVTSRSQAARELVRAPPAAAAIRRKRVGDEEDPHVVACQRSSRNARSRARQCASQL